MPADYRNDALHPLLSRALPVAQATLDRLEPGRASYGACRVLEDEGNGGLTDFTMGGSVTGEAWSVNPYAGCLHACSYCYVPDTIHAERTRWGSYVVVKRDLPRQLALRMQKEAKKGKKLTTYLSTSTDPYQPAEAEHGITRKCLEVLARRDWPVEVLTRSPLVLRDRDLFRQFSQVRVGMSVPTLDDEVRRVLEPNAPPIPARLDALRQLADEGIPTFANYTPACPPTGFQAADVAKAFLEAGVQWANTTRWKRRATTLAPLWLRLRGTPHEHLAKFFASKPRQHAWNAELHKAFKRTGLALSGSFFNPPFEWHQPKAITLQEFEPALEQPLEEPLRTAGQAGRPLPVLQVARWPRGQGFTRQEGPWADGPPRRGPRARR